MTVFLYSSDLKGKGKEIHQIMEELLPSDRIEVHRSIESLSRKLQEPQQQRPVVIVLVFRREELLDIVSIREQLHQFRLILVLPDAEKETISLGHSLRPNYLTYVHRDLEELKAVLKKMLKSDGLFSRKKF